jgi:hypothetical protein
MSLPVHRTTAPRPLASWLRWETSPDYCRDAATLLAGSGAARLVKTGQLIGMIAGALEATAAAKTGGNAANTGAFTLDATTPVLAGAKIGVYQLRCLTAAANGGTFRLRDPDGYVLGDYAISGGAGGTVTVANHIKGVIADGTQDFVVGEGFDITVAADTDATAIGKAKAWDPAATDGSQVVAGVAIADTEAADGADNVAGLVVLARGPAIVQAAQLVWPAGVGDGQKAAALAALAARGIVAR